MAYEDINISPEGSGPAIAVDNISGVRFQRIKESLGGEGSATDKVGGAGAVTAGVERVTLASDDPAVTQIGGLTETAPATDTASSGLNGRLQRIAQRITSFIALIPAALTGSGNFKVAVQEALPAGTNAIGKLAANSGVDIGDVTVDNAAGAAAVNIQDGGNSITVDAASLPLPTGAATAARQALPGTAGTASAEVLSVQGITSMTPLKVDASATTQPVSATSLPLPTGAATEATLDTRSGSLTETAPATDTASSGLNGRLQRVAQRITSLIALLPAALTGSGNLKVAVQEALPAGTADIGFVHELGYIARCQTDITRPSDTTAYAIGDALSDSTSAPTSGGFTLTPAGRASGKGGVITDLIVASSNNPATLLAGEIWIFNQAVTNINDNAAFTVSTTDIKNFVGRVSFLLIAAGASSVYHASNLAIGFVCSGSANLRYLVKVNNTYTPASGEVITVAAKVIGVD